MNIWITFAFLQIMDVMTTLAFLALGVGEAHPLFRWTIAQFGPIRGLLWKLPAVLALVVIGLICQKKRVGFDLSRAMRLVNGFFMFVVLWNMSAIVIKLYDYQ